MLQCWRSEPWERPSFRRCLGTLQSISGELRRSELPEIEGSSASCSSASSASVKPETPRVRFDEAIEQHNQTKDASTISHNNNNNNNTPTSSSNNCDSSNDNNRQLYANEGVSRL